MVNKSIMSDLKADLPAGLVVFLVALPLCLGIALASGAPMFSGIIAGIIGGLIVASVSGSHVSVSGPAAGLTVIVFGAIQSLGSFEVFLFAVVLAGMLQIVLGILRAGIIGYYFPSSVIKGMLAAIGLILIFKQIPYALGHGEAKGDHYFEAIWVAIQNIHTGAVIIALVSVGIILFWDLPFMKRIAFFKFFPGALAVVIVGILLNYLFSLASPALAVPGTELVQLPVANSAMEFFSFFTLPDFSQWNNPAVYKVAFTIAIIASLESLLSVEAADKLDPHKRNTPTNRELIAQGTGNMLSGLIGGLPVTAVIVRTSANINAGSQSKKSAIFHGILLLLSAMFIPGLLNIIPLASLAAVLLVVGYKLAKVSLFKEMYVKGWGQFVPFVVTVGAILATDLLVGIVAGIVVGVFFILKDNYKTPYFFHSKKQGVGEVATMELSEHVSFLNKGSIMLTLSELPDDSAIVIDGSKSQQIDYDVLEILHDFVINASDRNIRVYLKNINLEGISPTGH